MKKYLILISFFSVFFFTELHAGAAEKWEYEPKMKDLNIEVKAYKVDQFGDAVNDYEYNTKVDPKTTANKTKMGSVGIARLLKSNLYSALGNYALEQLLNAVDWVIDPEAQSIWRNKKTDTSDPSSCNYVNGGGTRLLFYTGNWNIDVESNCPYGSAEKLAKHMASVYSSEYSGNLKFINLTNPIDGNVEFTFDMKSNGSTSTMSGNLQTKPDPNPSTETKEYLTPEALADYANHTHPDYTDPKRAPALEPKYSPEIAEKLWKPGNEWEYENSPTVQEVKKQLEKSNPEPKTEPEIKPNPETGGLTIPPFCEIAAPVCEFIKWFKETPEEPETIKVPEKELDRSEIKTDLVKASSNSCPADIVFNVNDLPFGIKINKAFQMQPICNAIEPLKYVFQLGTFLLCGFILLRV